jgi:predicted alpha/beta superfamily hydrolase
MKFLLITILVAFCTYSNAQFPKVEIAGSQVRKITSYIVPGQEYDLQIMLPSGYETSNKKYPVVYLMDSQWDFSLVNALYGEQYFDGFVPAMIIVGVTWGGTNPNPDSLRARDYTPTKEARAPQSGGAANFLAALKKEIIPFVESNYKADNSDRILMGCSLGGLFTLYSMFTEPGLFQRYVATTPAIGWDNEVIYQYEKAYFEKKSTAPARLFITMGEVERELPAYTKFINHLNSRKYTSIQLKSRVLENTGHSGNKGEGYARGLQYVFARPSMKLDNATLSSYVGSYTLANGNTVDIKTENNQLVLYFSPTNRYPLKAANEKDFYSTAEFLNLSFNKGLNNNASSFLLERYGSSQLANKLK